MTTVHAGRTPQDVQERYRRMFERVATGIAIVDRAGRFLECNPAFCSLVGHSPERLADLTFAELVHPDDRADNLRQWQRLLDGLIASYDLRNRYLRPDGAEIWVQKQVLALRDQHDPAQQIIVLATDLTEQRRAEEALRDRALGLRRFVADSPIPVAMLDRDMRYLSYSPEWIAAFGLENVDIRGRSHYELFPLIGKRWRRIFARCLDGAIERGDQERVLGPDGATRWVRWEIRPWRTPGGPIGGIIIHSEDITARKNAEAALHQSHAALRQRTSELRRQAGQLHRQAGQLRQLASDLTLADQRARERLSRMLHDHLQQLLFSASLKLERLSKRVSEDPAAAADLAERTRRDLDEAIASARSLALELFPPVLRERGLPAALAWLADWMRATYGLTVTLSADAQANPERDDVRTLLFESVRELLFNVVKHAGVSEASVVLSLEPGDMLTITVRDAGAGFTTERVFHEPDIAHGLGLFSIRERLVLMGGRLEATSAPGGGACITLTVPRRTQGRVEDPLADPAGAVPDRPLRVLIADDHAAVRGSLREMLDERQDLQVVAEASDGTEAVALAFTTTPDVVIMDISMPGMDGVEATRRIHAQLPLVQVVGLSTHAPGVRVHAMLDAGATVCFPKGDDSSALMDWLIAAHAALPENRHPV